MKTAEMQKILKIRKETVRGVGKPSKNFNSKPVGPKKEFKYVFKSLEENTENINKEQKYQYAESIEQVMNALEINIEELLSGSDQCNMNIIGFKTVPTKKYKFDGTLDGRKASSYKKKLGIDFNETFAPIARLESLSLLFIKLM